MTPEYVPIICATLTRQEHLNARYSPAPHHMRNFNRSIERGTLGRAYAVQQDGRWVCGHCGHPVSVAW